MKTVLLAASIALSMTSLPPVNAAQHKTENHDAHGNAHTGQPTAGATHSGRGKVVSADSAAGTVKLTHDPIASLKWPKMTMDFKAHDAAMLEGLKPGMQVDFELMKMGGAYHLMKLSPAAQ